LPRLRGHGAPRRRIKVSRRSVRQDHRTDLIGCGGRRHLLASRSETQPPNQPEQRTPPAAPRRVSPSVSVTPASRPPRPVEAAIPAAQHSAQMAASRFISSASGSEPGRGPRSDCRRAALLNALTCRCPERCCHYGARGWGARKSEARARRPAAMIGHPMERSASRPSVVSAPAAASRAARRYGSSRTAPYAASSAPASRSTITQGSGGLPCWRMSHT